MLVTVGGEVVDGRHRQELAAELGVCLCGLTTELPADADAVLESVRANAHRRQMLETQAGVVAYRLSLDILTGRYTPDVSVFAGRRIDQDSVDEHCSRLLSVSLRTLQRVRAVYEFGDEQLIALIERLGVSADGAYEQVRRRKARARKAAESERDAAAAEDEDERARLEWEAEKARKKAEQTEAEASKFVEMMTERRAARAERNPAAVEDVDTWEEVRVGRIAREESHRERVSLIAEDYLPPSHVDIQHRSVEEWTETIEPGSVDAVVTDPPYDRESVNLFAAAAVFAGRALRDDGSLLVMCGNDHFDLALRALTDAGGEAGLRFESVLALRLTKRQQSRRSKVFIAWKPVVWMTKGEGGYSGAGFPNEVSEDLVEHPNEFHKWGQTVACGVAVLKPFFQPGGVYHGGTVADPLCGGGAFLLAAQNLGAGAVLGGDIDPEAVAISTGRLIEQ